MQNLSYTFFKIFSDQKHLTKEIEAITTQIHYASFKYNLILSIWDGGVSQMLIFDYYEGGDNEISDFWLTGFVGREEG